MAPETACNAKARGWISEIFESDNIVELVMGLINLKNYAGNDGKVKNETRVGVIVNMTKISCTLGSIGEIEP